jgi:hypothetical protein
VLTGGGKNDPQESRETPARPIQPDDLCSSLEAHHSAQNLPGLDPLVRTRRRIAAKSQEEEAAVPLFSHHSMRGQSVLGCSVESNISETECSGLDWLHGKDVAVSNERRHTPSPRMKTQ